MSEALITEREEDRKAMRQLCRRVMRGRKSNVYQKLQAAQLLAAISGWYGPGRPRGSALEELQMKDAAENKDGAKELASRERIERLVRGEEPKLSPAERIRRAMTGESSN
jgi:hypothetical protein